MDRVRILRLRRDLGRDCVGARNANGAFSGDRAASGRGGRLTTEPYGSDESVRGTALLPPQATRDAGGANGAAAGCCRLRNLERHEIAHHAHHRPHRLCGGGNGMAHGADVAGHVADVAAEGADVVGHLRNIATQLPHVLRHAAGILGDRRQIAGHRAHVAGHAGHGFFHDIDDIKDITQCDHGHDRGRNAHPANALNLVAMLLISTFYLLIDDALALVKLLVQLAEHVLHAIGEVLQHRSLNLGAPRLFARRALLRRFEHSLQAAGEGRKQPGFLGLPQLFGDRSIEFRRGGLGRFGFPRWALRGPAGGLARAQAREGSFGFIGGFCRRALDGDRAGFGQRARVSLRCAFHAWV